MTVPCTTPCTIPTDAQTWCDACEGTGKHYAHMPSFYDPYYVHPTNRPCLKCDGTGIVPRTCEHCGDDLNADGSCSEDCEADRVLMARLMAEVDGE